MKPEHHLSRHLLQILGEADFVRLCQELGGTRIYVPYKAEGSELANAIGGQASEKLSRALAPATIRVPLARRERALFYRRQGLTDPQIARKLGITENGVAKLFDREAELPERQGSRTSAAQLSLL
jgi:hypothetical protein